MLSILADADLGYNAGVSLQPKDKDGEIYDLASVVSVQCLHSPERWVSKPMNTF